MALVVFCSLFSELLIFCLSSSFVSKWVFVSRLFLSSCASPAFSEVPPVDWYPRQRLAYLNGDSSSQSRGLELTAADGFDCAFL